TGNFMPPTPDLSFTSLDEFVNKPVVENIKSDEEVSKVVKKSDNGPIIEEWVSDSNDENVSQTKTEKKTVKPSIAKIDASITLKKFDYIDAQGRSKSVMAWTMKRDGGYVAFGGNPKGRIITGKVTIKTDDYSRFTWVFFLATKDETSGILKSFITCIENLVDHKVKVIRCDNGTEFKIREMNQFCEMKGILRQFSVARTPQQNRLAERGNMTQIKAVRTMLVDSKLATTFWAKAVNTACYVQNRVLVVKPHNKTLYERFHDRTPTLSFMRPFGCPVTILNTIDHLGKFDGKADEGFFVGYSLNSK
ncbi:ribonuclease H-like domain-containing protein, partial [Tanacetum coccineum]